MSYAIATIIYGIPLETNGGSELSEELEELLDEGENGFLSLYSSGGMRPQAFGVVISEFDECCHHIDIGDINFQASSQQVENFMKLYEELSTDIQKEICKFGLPHMFLLWNSA